MSLNRAQLGDGESNRSLLWWATRSKQSYFDDGKAFLMVLSSFFGGGDFPTRLIEGQFAPQDMKSNLEIHTNNKQKYKILRENSVWKKSQGGEERIHYFQRITVNSTKL